MSKILHIITDTNFGGAGRYITLIDEFLDQKDHDFYLMIPRGSQLKDHVHKMTVIEVDKIADQSFSLGGLKALRGAIKDLQPDIIHTHGSLAGRMAGRLLNIKTVFTKHTLSQPASGLKLQMKKVLHGLLKSKAIAVSKGAYHNLQVEGFKDKDISLIYNGVGDQDHDESATVKGRLLMVGRLEPIKGPFDALTSIKLLRDKYGDDFQLVLAGEGSLRQEMEERVKNQNLPVEFLGHVSDIHPLYASAHVVINTSQSEALPYAMIEAMSHSKPVVAFNIPGITEVVVNGQTGHIVDYQDYDDFADCLHGLLTSDDLCHTMGRASRERVDQLFSVKQMIDKLMKVYEAMYESN